MRGKVCFFFPGFHAEKLLQSTFADILFFLFPPRALLFTLALSSKYVASKGYHCEADVKGTCAESKSHVHLGSNLFKNYYGLISDIYAIAF